MSVFKDIPDTNSNYQISKEGIIFSKRRQGNKGGVIKQLRNRNGYLYSDIYVDGKKKKIYIHRAVALAFLDNPENKPCINHKDGNKLNNSVENLEWCTYSENMKHAVSKGLNKIPRLSGSEHPMHKLTEENVYKIRELFVKG